MATLDAMRVFLQAIAKSRRKWVCLLAFACLAFGTTGCGVKLEADQTTTEIFKNVSVTDSVGDPKLAAGQTIVLHVEYTQLYAAQIDIECDLLSADGSTKVSDIYVVAIPGNSPDNIPTSILKNYRDEVTPTNGRFDQSFIAPASPGQYLVHCFTQEDDNNEIERIITIGDAPTGTPEP